MNKYTLTEKIIGVAIEVHRILGLGLLESIYEEALCHEFSQRDIHFEKQVPIEIVYKGHAIHGQIIALLVKKEVVIEIKALQKLPEVSTAQVLTYLKALWLKCALLMNFGEKKLVDGVKRLFL